MGTESKLESCWATGRGPSPWKRRTALSRSLLFLVLQMLVALSRAQYVLKDLGDGRQAFAVNSSRLIVGDIINVPGGRTYAWYRQGDIEGQITDLPASRASAVTEGGRMAGSALDDAVFWPSINDAAQVLARPSGALTAQGLALNDLGQVAGYAQPPGDPRHPIIEAVLWSQGNPSVVAGYTGIWAINASGEFLTSPYGATDHFARLITNSAIVRLVPPGGPSASYASRLNDRTEVAVAGEYPLSDGNVELRPFIYSRGRYQELSLPAGATFIGFDAINNAGWTLGTCLIDGSEQSFLWRGSSPVSVRSLSNGWGAAWTDLKANGLNDRGDIVGVASDVSSTTGTRAFALWNTLAWGQYVRLRLKDGSLIDDYLVALQDREIVVASGLEFQGDIVTSPKERRIEQSDIDSVELIRPPAGSLPSVNLYLMQGVDVAVALNGPVCYESGGGWSVVPRFFNGREYADGKPRGATQLVAIARAPGINDPALVQEIMLKAAGSTYDLGDNLSKERLFSPQLLYAGGWHESFSKTDQVGWNQFGFTVLESRETVDRLAYPGLGTFTTVTGDGGIGIMQLTARTALDGVRPQRPEDPLNLEDRLTHVWRLCVSASYNIRAGAMKLARDGWRKKFFIYADEASTAVLNHWYPSLGAYRGETDPSQLAYSNAVWDLLRKAPYRALVDVPSTQPLAELTGSESAQFLDVDYDGEMDYLFQRLSWKKNADGSLTISVAAPPYASGGAFATSISVSVILKSGGRSDDITMRRLEDGTYVATVPGLGSYANFKPSVMLNVTAKGVTRLCFMQSTK